MYKKMMKIVAMSVQEVVRVMMTVGVGVEVVTMLRMEVVTVETEVLLKISGELQVAL